ncbi:hypothetical protein [Leuconostoc citreum]
MDMTGQVLKFIEAQPDYNGNGRYVISCSSVKGWSLTYHTFGRIELVEYSFKLNEQGLPFEYKRVV